MHTIDVTIETPRGSSEKFAWDEARGIFRLKKILPAGMAFPYDFGFVPGTRAEDGDPLDVIVLSEHRSFPGCVMECRILGALLARQTDKDEPEPFRNDRLLAVSVLSRQLDAVETLDDLRGPLLDDLERFFRTYHEAEGGTLEILERVGSKKAWKLVEEAKA